MALENITLDNIRQVVREESDASFDRKFGPAFAQAFDKAFKPAFMDAFEPFADAIQQDFNNINERFDRLETKVDAIADDVKGLKRIVGQHSKEIIELRARIA